jgi:hypothetical protein
VVDVLGLYMSKVSPEPNSGCWLWLGLVDEKGYGRFGKGGRAAHRKAYELFIGEIPKGLCVLHTCDVRSCVNPKHLWLGLPADNTRDMLSKGRASGGLASGMSNIWRPKGSKHTMETKRKMRAAWKARKCR